LENALEAQRLIWKLIGILAILGLGFLFIGALILAGIRLGFIRL
jgi:hypothetical protein